MKAAQLHNFALRLHLRRLRRNLVGAQHTVAVNRLLDATDAFDRALEWLSAKTNIVDNHPPALGLVPMDAQAMPDAVGAPQ